MQSAVFPESLDADTGLLYLTRITEIVVRTGKSGDRVVDQASVYLLMAGIGPHPAGL